MAIRVAINGYGRIGRDVHRQILKTDDLEIVAINSHAGADSHAHLLKYDSLYGKCDAEITVEGKNLRIDGRGVFVYQQKDISGLNWGQHDVDVVIESTGRFTECEDANLHIKSGAKKVLITAPCKDPRVTTIVMGVNDKEHNPKEKTVFSNASCTTNCLAPVMKVLCDNLGVEVAFVTTTHAFTNTQNLLDNSSDDFRRARATTESLIPTTTGAMKAIGEVLPDLKGRIDGMAIRVPIPTVSLIDVVAQVKRSTSVEELNEMFRKAEAGDMKGILGTSLEPLVSVDYRGDTRSSIVDLLSTRVLRDQFVNIFAWYDNEWGYAARVVDLIRWMFRQA